MRVTRVAKIHDIRSKDMSQLDIDVEIEDGGDETRHSLKGHFDTVEQVGEIMLDRMANDSAREDLAG